MGLPPWWTRRACKAWSDGSTAAPALARPLRYNVVGATSSGELDLFLQALHFGAVALVLGQAQGAIKLVGVRAPGSHVLRSPRDR